MAHKRNFLHILRPADPHKTNSADTSKLATHELTRSLELYGTNRQTQPHKQHGCAHKVLQPNSWVQPYSHPKIYLFHLWPQAAFCGTAPEPPCPAHAFTPKTADTNVPPCPVKLPAVTKNFSATKLKFQRASVTVSGWKVSKSIGLYYIVTSWQIQASTPFLRGISKVLKDWAPSALLSAPPFRHSGTSAGVWRSPFGNQSKDLSSKAQKEKQKAGSKARNESCFATQGVPVQGLLQAVLEMFY